MGDPFLRRHLDLDMGQGEYLHTLVMDRQLLHMGRAMYRSLLVPIICRRDIRDRPRLRIRASVHLHIRDRVHLRIQDRVHPHIQGRIRSHHMHTRPCTHLRRTLRRPDRRRSFPHQGNRHIPVKRTIQIQVRVQITIQLRVLLFPDICLRQLSQIQGNLADTSSLKLKGRNTSTYNSNMHIQRRISILLIRQATSDKQVPLLRISLCRIIRCPSLHITQASRVDGTPAVRVLLFRLPFLVS
jgi:hypothetical protein